MMSLSSFFLWERWLDGEELKSYKRTDLYRAHSSAVEHYLHTVGVAGSIPAAPTMNSRYGSFLFETL